MKNVLLLLLAFGILLACNPEPPAPIDQEEGEEVEITYNIPEGFELEELYIPKANNDGSWVALAEGEEGTFYASDQHGALYTFKVPAVGEVLDSNQIDTIKLNIGKAHGLLWAFDGLYVSVNDRWLDGEGEPRTEAGSGVYKLTDTDGDGKLDNSKMLLKLEGAGEHGPHSLVLSPDGTKIYFIAGNYTHVPEAIVNNSRLPNHWKTDNLFPPFLDARGHANDIEPPGGWIARFDPNGTNWELVASGFRNPFDMAFNGDGELFAFDADMEWDIGMPWYRPIRVCHATSGAAFGWRTGSGKWPTYYPDNLPAVVNLGQGSPTAVVSTLGLNLPSHYEDGLIVFDWSFGTAYFIELKADGSSYTGTKEEFFSGTPLPLTDAIVGSDGALYFATGGRSLDSHFYRLRYTGNEQNQGEGKLTATGGAVNLRALRKRLEAFHKKAGADAIPFIWENLNHADRFIRYAARVALEHQPVSSWSGRLRQEQDLDRILLATIALVRTDSNTAKAPVYEKLLSLDWSKMERSKQLDYLRAVGLTAMRLGPPNANQANAFIQKLGPHFPADDYAMDRELGQLLMFLGDETATAKCLQLLKKHTDEKTITHPSLLSEEVSLRSEDYGPTILDMLKKMPPTEAIFYSTLLSNASKGWDKEGRELYFNWFYDGLNAAGGMSFKPFLENIRKRAMTHVPDSLKAYYEELSGVFQPASVLANLPQPEGPGEDYKPGQIGGIVGRGLRDYEGSIEEGKRMFEAALCAVCHRIAGEGGNSGPDLTQVATRFKRGEIINAIYSPNDAISDQYAFTLLELKDGKNVAGKILSENAEQIVIAPNPYTPTYTMEVPKADVVSRGPSPISPMPANLLNRLNEEEITHLFAYMLSGGNKNHYLYGGTDGLEEEE